MELYRILHFLGISLVVMALGGALLHAMNGGTKASNQFRKGTMISHGVGMLLILVAGFGMLARLGIHSIPLWVGLKLGIWLILGALIGVVYRKPTMAKLLWCTIPVLVMVAAYAGRNHLGG